MRLSAPDETAARVFYPVSRGLTAFGALGAALGIAPAFWAMATVLAGGGYWLRKP